MFVSPKFWLKKFYIFYYFLDLNILNLFITLNLKFLIFYRSSWRTWMGADSSDSILSISRYRGCGDDDPPSLSKVSIISIS